MSCQWNCDIYYLVALIEWYCIIYIKNPLFLFISPLPPPPHILRCCDAPSQCTSVDMNKYSRCALAFACVDFWCNVDCIHVLNISFYFAIAIFPFPMCSIAILPSLFLYHSLVRLTAIFCTYLNLHVSDLFV